ncbi:MAG: 5-methylcytosine-specific restriction endonuclease system specificity protein McrC [bacterium]|nr:5-methylcytosine-specific restriction endonuclease system specificity protein McrC [bacterium]
MSAQTGTVGYVGSIPVRNLWLLMLYASRLYREIPANRRFAAEENPDDIPNLVAEILVRAVQIRLRRNLSAELLVTQADLIRVRGRIDHLRTRRHSLLERGKVACIFDELTTDTPRNRYVLAALRKLVRVVSDEDLARRCRTIAGALERAGVRPQQAGSLHSARTRSHAAGRAHTEDRRMLAAARLAFDLGLPTEEAGRSHLTSPDRDKRWAERLFEAAVGGFYDTVLAPRNYRVTCSTKIRWPTEDETPGMTAILPIMERDIVLERPPAADGTRPRVVIDTKFTRILKRSHHGVERLHSGYIYQIYAYLRSQESRHDPRSLDSEGLLLHPSVEGEVDEAATIQGHRIRFATVDLAADSVAIRSRLLSLVGAG